MFDKIWYRAEFIIFGLVIISPAFKVSQTMGVLLVITATVFFKYLVCNRKMSAIDYAVKILISKSRLRLFLYYIAMATICSFLKIHSDVITEPVFQFVSLTTLLFNLIVSASFRRFKEGDDKYKHAICV